MSTLVLTAIGDDRPGLVDVLSGVISAHGGSWERSRMARLGGRFAGIVEVVLPEQQVVGLRRALADLGEVGTLQVTVAGAGDSAMPEGPRVGVQLMGSDQPGLLHAVTSVLSDVGASIEELSTALRDAPMAGGTTFEAVATVVLPDEAAIEGLRRGLEDLASHLMVDIELTD
jgi:glycine cleavage system regulatory protein